MDHARPYFQSHLDVRAPAVAPNLVASESNVSADPTWINVGGKPRKKMQDNS
jgi:hypothetical protein